MRWSATQEITGPSIAAEPSTARSAAHRGVGLEAAVGEEAVEADRDTEAREEIDDREHDQVGAVQEAVPHLPADEAEGEDRPDRDQRGERPVEPLVFDRLDVLRPDLPPKGSGRRGIPRRGYELDVIRPASSELDAVGSGKLHIGGVSAIPRPEHREDEYRSWVLHSKLASGALLCRNDDRLRRPHRTSTRAQMPFARTEPLRRELSRALPERPFALRFWDGAELPATVPGSPVFTARSPAAVAHLLRAPGQLGLGRAYATGELEADDLDRVIGLLDSFRAPALDDATRLRLAAAAVRACGLTRPPRIPPSELRPRGSRHSRARDARAVRHHYDVSNDFFKLFLDASMTYSCADLLPRREHAGGRAAGQAGDGVHEARPQGGRAAARCGLRLGQLRAARRHPPRGERGGDHALPQPGGARAPKGGEGGPRGPRGDPPVRLPRPCRSRETLAFDRSR